MNIPICPLQKKATGRDRITCPGCHTSRYRKHGSYVRKGFHFQKYGVPILVSVLRYLCLNPECPKCTFSVLPPMVMRYCRFFWPCLLSVKGALDAGSSCYHVAHHVWHVSWAVIQRAAVLVQRLGPWVNGLHQELTNGGPARELELMVKIVTAKIGRLELVHRWYRHRYPRRFY